MSSNRVLNRKSATIKRGVGTPLRRTHKNVLPPAIRRGPLAHRCFEKKNESPTVHDIPANKRRPRVKRFRGMPSDAAPHGNEPATERTFTFPIYGDKREKTTPLMDGPAAAVCCQDAQTNTKTAASGLLNRIAQRRTPPSRIQHCGGGGGCRGGGGGGGGGGDQAEESVPPRHRRV